MSSSSNTGAWGGGYVTDVTYMPGYYRQQSPAHMAVACLLGGVACAVPGPDTPIHYLELGCGQGYGALLLAASNPDWRVTAVDFNPAHIANGRAWAAEAGLGNITFIEADFATIAETAAGQAIPMADFVSLHGVWSWVPPAARRGIVRLLDCKLTPGGVLHISFNALPGWSGALAMQRLLREGGRRLSWRSDRQAEQGLALVRELSEAGAQHLRTPLVSGILSRAQAMSPEYLAHEYMNDFWEPCWHADVVAALAGAKLEWVASAVLTENFPDLALTDTQRAIYQRFDDPLMRELVKDACLARQLRHDVFVRGARRIDPSTRDRALMDLRLTAGIPPGEMPLEVDMPAGHASLSPAFYGPIMRAISTGPHRVGDLLELPDVQGRRDNPAELVGILVGLGYALPVQRPDAETHPTARRFNRFSARAIMRPEHVARAAAAASTMVGAGVPLSTLELFVLDRLDRGEGEGDLEAWMRDLGPANEESAVRLREALTKILRDRISILRAAGAA
ncbi:MAG: class I SAM-dependent methyltransferase [Acetobacteraceae bacterium]